MKKSGYKLLDEFVEQKRLEYLNRIQRILHKTGAKSNDDEETDSDA